MFLGCNSCHFIHLANCNYPDIRVAPNVQFYVEDVEDEWDYHNPFDFIYARMMTGSIKDWPKFFRQSYQ